MLIIVSGLPGSGKTYFASRLADRLGALYISSDRTRKQMLVERSYTPEEKAKVYDQMQEKMEQGLREGKVVVLDGTFYRQAIRDQYVQAWRVLGPAAGRLFQIEVRAEEGLVRERLGQPRVDSEADQPVYVLIKRQWEPMEGDHLVLESRNDNIEDMLRQAIAYIQKAAP